MQKEDIKFGSSAILEGMTSVRALLYGREHGIHDRPILRVLYDRARERKLYRELGFLRSAGQTYGFPVEGVSSEEIEERAIGTSHGGILAECGERVIPKLCDGQDALSAIGFYVMIQGIEDPYNFGYALRSLYACGIDGVILSERNWMSAAGVVARASAGASEMLPAFIATAEEAADVFHAAGYCVVCADERTEHILPETPLKKPLLLIIGGERRGISRALLDRADVLVKIPYGRGFRASLSAASAATILGYEVMRQNRGQ